MCSGSDGVVEELGEQGVYDGIGSREGLGKIADASECRRAREFRRAQCRYRIECRWCIECRWGRRRRRNHRFAIGRVWRHNAEEYFFVECFLRNFFDKTVDR